MPEWFCMDPSAQDTKDLQLICDYESCEILCPYRVAQNKLNAMRGVLPPQILYTDYRYAASIEKFRRILDEDQSVGESTP